MRPVEMNAPKYLLLVQNSLSVECFWRALFNSHELGRQDQHRSNRGRGAGRDDSNSFDIGCYHLLRKCCQDRNSSSGNNRPATDPYEWPNVQKLESQLSDVGTVREALTRLTPSTAFYVSVTDGNSTIYNEVSDPLPSG
mgnify:CR=1 FL=1